MGFIGYSRKRSLGGQQIIRIYLECRENSPMEGNPEGVPRITCGSTVDVAFPSGKAPCRLHGVEGVLVLKKFYKLVFSLEERAREHGNDWRGVMESPESLLEHLRYTRNARDLTGQAEPHPASCPERAAEPEDVPACGKR